MATEPEVEATLDFYRLMGELAPVAIATQWNDIVHAMETASTVAPADPNSQQQVALQAYATERSAYEVAVWLKRNCGVDIPITTIAPQEPVPRARRRPRSPTAPRTTATAGRVEHVTTFVLVHGAWAGAHGWRSVRKLLAAEGHEVFTPSLTGIGERVHLASPQVDLTTHVNDVVNQIVFEDLRDIVLVGYSYGGVVVTAAVEHVHDRVRELCSSTHSCRPTATPPSTRSVPRARR